MAECSSARVGILLLCLYVENFYNKLITKFIYSVNFVQNLFKTVSINATSHSKLGILKYIL